jgi:hypothetical protein
MVRVSVAAYRLRLVRVSLTDPAESIAADVLPAGLGRLGEPPGQMRHLPGIPGVDLGQFLLGVGVAVGLVGEGVLALVDAQPLHVGLADRVGVLEGRDPGEVGRQRGDDQTANPTIYRAGPLPCTLACGLLYILLSRVTARELQGAVTSGLTADRA